MHQAAYDFVTRATSGIEMKGKRLLEIGSYNVNGSVRPLFAGCQAYTGIDPRPGPGVDVAVAAQGFRTKKRFDIVVSCETLEHDPDPEGIIACAWRSLKPGGVLILTAAGPGRVPHNCMGGPDVSGEHYENVSPETLQAWLADWEAISIEVNPVAHDVYATARKPETEPITQLTSAEQEQEDSE